MSAYLWVLLLQLVLICVGCACGKTKYIIYTLFNLMYINVYYILYIMYTLLYTLLLLSQGNMVFNKDRIVVVKNVHLLKGYSARHLMEEFPAKSGIKMLINTDKTIRRLFSVWHTFSIITARGGATILRVGYKYYCERSEQKIIFWACTPTYAIQGGTTATKRHTESLPDSVAVVLVRF